MKTPEGCLYNTYIIIFVKHENMSCAYITHISYIFYPHTCADWFDGSTFVEPQDPRSQVATSKA